jgi:hypothetical protein
LVVKVRLARTGVFLMAMPALWMSDAEVSGLAAAAVWTCLWSSWSSATSAAHFSLRMATAPLVRARAAVSAVWRSVMAWSSTARVGVVVGNEALPVSAFVMPCT